MDVVLSADGETDAVTGRHNDGSRPDLDIELDYLVLRKRLDPVVGVIGPIGRGQPLVESAVRGPQPALADRSVRIDGALEHYLAEVAFEDAQHHEQIGVLGRG